MRNVLKESKSQPPKLAVGSIKLWARRIKFGRCWPRSATALILNIFKVKDVVDFYRDELSRENMANQSSVQAYIGAVRAARQADKKTLSEIFNDEKNKEIRCV